MSDIILQLLFVRRIISCNVQPTCKACVDFVTLSQSESSNSLLTKIVLLKGSIFLKNRHFIIKTKKKKKRFTGNKLIHGINTIIKCGTACKISVSLLHLK